mmetsp:Transcript_57708/g.95413  ORF Transcript_57708/g.95413 Transcript_57708/m.95413 type:complete len:88 (-) Transcript_57708:598-861(-)
MHQWLDAIFSWNATTSLGNYRYCINGCRMQSNPVRIRLTQSTDHPAAHLFEWPTGHRHEVDTIAVAFSVWQIVTQMRAVDANALAVG